jgi:ribonuclease P protein component
MQVKNRIKKQNDFQKIIKTGKCYRNSLYTIYCLTNDLNLMRIGISIPTKSGNAVTRNKIKRQIKSMLVSFIDLNKKIDLVIIPRKNYSTNEFVENKVSIKNLIESIGEYK